MKQTWLYLQNPFFNCTKKNFKKAVKISAYTDAQLLAKSGDAFFASLYADYHPLHLLLVAAYNIWKAQGGTQKGSTVTVRQLLGKLSPGKIGIWDRAVQLLFDAGSAVYVAIFPKGHKSFQKGPKLDRISAVAQPQIALTGKVGLEATLADVTAFSGELDIANTKQSGNVGTTNTTSDDVETARVNAMGMLYKILGQCMARYWAKPTLATVLFDLNSIRNTLQSIFTGALKKSIFETIAQRTFLIDDTIDATNDGLSLLGFYLAENPGDGPEGYTVIQVLSTKTDTIKISQFVNNTTNNFLCVVNLSDTLGGHFSVNVA